MSNNVAQEYPNGIWYIINDKDGNTMAQKRFNTTSETKQITVPLSKEILEVIKKQIEANKIFNAFQKINNDDTNIIGYLNLILDDYVNFLDTYSLSQLIGRLKAIEESNYLDSQNIIYVGQLRTNLESKDIESFYDILEQFQSHNKQYFDSVCEKQENAKAL